MIHQFNLPKYLDDRDSDFNDFESVSSEQLKFYEPKYKAMMGNKFKNKEKTKFSIHKSQTHKKGSNSTSPAISIHSQGRAQFVTGKS